MSYKGTRTPSRRLLWLPAFALPLTLIGLFHILKTNTPLMDRWVFGCMAPVMQWFGWAWSVLPFSAGELLTALFLISAVFGAFFTLFRALKTRKMTRFCTYFAALLCTLIWLWSGLCWLWNCTYYASSFTARAGLTTQPYSFEQLVSTTAHFAKQAAKLSNQVPRDENLHFSQPKQDSLRVGPTVYDNLSQQLPALELHSVQAKPLFFSRLQSRLGFTGVYFPFTGEANVNTDAPNCLFPATIAHEMSHQHMVAAEAEANFVGILACVTCEDATYQYSGYLMGLVHLSNAVASVSPDALYAIMEEHFTPELSTDWNDNYYYWKELDSPVEEAAEQTYDSYLKQNDQPLGIQSYGACVDLLVTYFNP